MSRAHQVREAMQVESRKPSGARVGIPPRQITFRFPDTAPRYFAYGENPLATALFVVFSGIFPPGERFFARSVRNFRDRIVDPDLRDAVSGFMGQEAIHGREHERLNERFVELGFDVATPDRMVRFGLALLERLPETQQLACTTFMEHFTALLAERWLTDEEFTRTSDPEMLSLWYWHALEELEHKSVAYDVFVQVSDSRTERALAGPLVVAAILPGILFSWATILAKEGQLTNVRENLRGARLLFGRGGFLSSLLPKVPVFATERFHPNRHDTRAIEQEWRERLFGSEGVLRDAVRNRSAIVA